MKAFFLPFSFVFFVEKLNWNHICIHKYILCSVSEPFTLLQICINNFSIILYVFICIYLIMTIDNHSIAFHNLNFLDCIIFDSWITSNNEQKFYHLHSCMIYCPSSFFSFFIVFRFDFVAFQNSKRIFIRCIQWEGQYSISHVSIGIINLR